MNIDIGNSLLIPLRRLYFRIWRPAVLVIGLAAIAYLLYFRRLGILLPGFSAQELSAYLHSADWHHISTDPINAPYDMLVWLLAALLHHSLLATRAISACFGILAVIAFFVVIRPWYSFRVASLGTLLFATSAGFLHFARLGAPQILQMSILALLVGALWYKRSPKHRVLVGYVLVALCALLWYVPGMIWFEVLGCVLLWRTIGRQLLRASKLHLAICSGVFVAIVAPLAWASMRNPHLLVIASGIPSGIDAVSHVASNFYKTVLSIGVRSDGNPLLWVGHLPLLNAAELVLGAVGAYYYLYRERSRRAFFLVGAIAISAVLISFGGGVGFASLVPLLYLFIVHGIDHLLSRWFTVFPRNPIARYTGVGVICVMLFFSILYQVRTYFVAWPHNANTRQTFNLPSRRS